MDVACVSILSFVVCCSLVILVGVCRCGVGGLLGLVVFVDLWLLPWLCFVWFVGLGFGGVVGFAG